MNVLQNLIFPHLGTPAIEDMYVRLNDRVLAELTGSRLLFMEGGVASTDTFYNGLTVGTWKRCCRIDSLALQVTGAGLFVLTLGLHRHGQVSAWLAEHVLDLRAGVPVQVPLPGWSQLDDGMLFFRLRAMDRGMLEGAAYLTSDTPLHAVKLGLVITHFNRQALVGHAVERIRDGLLSRPGVEGRITLTVVDNSCNLPVETWTTHPAVRVIRNRNFGGSGGFTRGLLDLIDGGAHTHALFMDDDASCEVESVARSLALLQYSRDPTQAVAGALLRERAPWHLFEKGARFDGQVRPLCSGLDMRRVPDLLEAERPVARPDYGAWWFFAFPLAHVQRFPFPFFVRGDDVRFGLDNRFAIATLNGVASLGEDFATKHTPMTAYLDARYHLVHALLDRRSAASRIFWVGSRLFLKQLASYQYTSARAVTLALRHAALGPQFFKDNLDLHEVRAEIGSWQPSERMLPLDRSALQVRPARRREESALRRLARVLSLQGFLLPGFLLKDRITVQEKAFHGRASAVFRYRRVLYEHAPSGTGYMAEYDRARFFAEMGAFLRAFVQLLGRLANLRRAYATGYDEMTSAAFWRALYGSPASTAPPAAVEAKPSAVPSA